jgi:hypothetical protein
MGDENNRLDLLEQRVNSTFNRVEEKLDGISSALQGIVRIEERQVQTNTQLSALNTSAREQDSRLREVERAIPENLGKRLASIEVALPGLKELRRWVVVGVVSGVGMIGAAVLHTVLKG